MTTHYLVIEELWSAVSEEFHGVTNIRKVLPNLVRHRVTKYPIGVLEAPCEFACRMITTSGCVGMTRDGLEAIVWEGSFHHIHTVLLVRQETREGL